MRLLPLLLVCTLTVATGSAQWRWSNELSSQFESLSFSTHVQKAFANRYLLGIGVGNIGKERGADYNDNNTHSSFSFVPDTWNYEGSTLYHAGENTRIRGAQLQLMTGYYWESSKKKHGLRFNANFKIGWLFSSNTVFYKQHDTIVAIHFNQNIRFMRGIVSLDVLHTIRLTEKTTFYYGLKNGLFLPNSAYRPTEKQEAFRFYVPELCLGISRYFELKKKE